jgi:hypothetical protein
MPGRPEPPRRRGGAIVADQRVSQKGGASSVLSTTSTTLSTSNGEGPEGRLPVIGWSRPCRPSGQRFFWISDHWRSTSSRPPHMKKACSATWSYSPSAIFVKPSIESASDTVEPSMPVNCFAT